jgi:hypothetical protein
MRLTRFSCSFFKQQIPLASLRKRAQPVAARIIERRINPPGRKKSTIQQNSGGNA